MKKLILNLILLSFGLISYAQSTLPNNAWYSLQAEGRALTIPYDLSSDDAYVYMAPKYTGASGQKWRFFLVPGTTNRYHIVGAANPYNCLTLKNDKILHSKKTSYNNYYQQWEYRYSASSRAAVQYFKSVASPTKYLVVKDHNITLSTSSKSWSLKKMENIYVPPSYQTVNLPTSKDYNLTNKFDSDLLSIRRDKNGVDLAVKVPYKAGSNAQVWRFEKAGTDTYYVSSKLDGRRCLTAQGNYLYSKVKANTTTQKWRAVKSTTSGYFYLQNEATGRYLFGTNESISTSTSKQSWKYLIPRKEPITGEKTADLNLIWTFNKTTSSGGKVSRRAMGSYNIKYQTGVSGDALKVSSNTSLTYPANNFDPTNGTLEVWVKPSWSGNDRKTHTIFQFGGSGGMLMFKDGANNLRLIVNRYSPNGTSEKGVGINVSNWKAYEWKHIAYTWSKDALKLYINGELKATERLTTRISNPRDTKFNIGSDNGKNQWNGLVDELRIRNKVKTGTEIKETYLKNAKSINKPGKVLPTQQEVEDRLLRMSINPQLEKDMEKVINPRTGGPFTDREMSAAIAAAAKRLKTSVPLPLPGLHQLREGTAVKLSVQNNQDIGYFNRVTVGVGVDGSLGVGINNPILNLGAREKEVSLVFELSTEMGIVLTRDFKQGSIGGERYTGGRIRYSVTLPESAYLKIKNGSLPIPDLVNPKTWPVKSQILMSTDMVVGTSLEASFRGIYASVGKERSRGFIVGMSRSNNNKLMAYAGSKEGVTTFLGTGLGLDKGFKISFGIGVTSVLETSNLAFRELKINHPNTESPLALIKNMALKRNTNDAIIDAGKIELVTYNSAVEAEAALGHEKIGHIGGSLELSDISGRLLTIKSKDGSSKTEYFQTFLNSSNAWIVHLFFDKNENLTKKEYKISYGGDIALLIGDLYYSTLDKKYDFQKLGNHKVMLKITTPLITEIERRYTALYNKLGSNDQDKLRYAAEKNVDSLFGKVKGSKLDLKSKKKLSYRLARDRNAIGSLLNLTSFIVAKTGVPFKNFKVTITP